MNKYFSIHATLLMAILAGCGNHKEAEPETYLQVSERLELLEFEKWQSFQGVKDGEAHIEWRIPDEEKP